MTEDLALTPTAGLTSSLSAPVEPAALRMELTRKELMRSEADNNIEPAGPPSQSLILW